MSKKYDQPKINSRIIPDTVVSNSQRVCGPFIIVRKAPRNKNFNNSRIAIRVHQDEVRQAVSVNAHQYL